MIRFTAVLQQGSLYGFGLSETDLNRLMFNEESIFFDFGYINRPDIYGLILYLKEFEEPKDINFNEKVQEEITNKVISLVQEDYKLNQIQDLRVFPITNGGMKKFQELPYWGYETLVEITHPKDKQLFFSGRTDEDIENYLTNAGYLTPETKRTNRKK